MRVLLDGSSTPNHFNTIITHTIPNVNKSYFCGDQCPDQTSLVSLVIKSAINKY